MENAADAQVLAGLVVGGAWTPSAHLCGTVLPETVMTVSDCLTDLVEIDLEAWVAPWYVDLPAALAAAGGAHPKVSDLRVMAVHVSVSDRGAVMALIDGWIGGAPHPIRNNLAAMADPVGEPRGFEVVGFEGGRLHSWLCYDLHEQVLASGQRLHLTQLGLLASLDSARAVATMANAERGTANGTPLDIMWLPVLVAEC